MTHKRADCNTSSTEGEPIFHPYIRQQSEESKIERKTEKENKRLKRDRESEKENPTQPRPAGNTKHAPSKIASDHHHYHLTPRLPHPQKSGEGRWRCGWRGRRRRASQPIRR